MKKIKVVVPISGGKDSQACLILALMEFNSDEVLGLFCDTKNEHPLTYAHIEKMKELYGVEIKTINAGTVYEKVIKHKRWPGGGARHCTDELKITPSKVFYRELAKNQNDGFQVWLGMRTQESHERNKRYSNKINTELYEPHEILSKYPAYLGKLGIRFRLPVVDFSSNEIYSLIGDNLNPLYRLGFTRVGCAPCFASAPRDILKYFALDEFGKQQRIKSDEVGEIIGRKCLPIKDEITDDLFGGCGFCSI